jgi:hypothetical protein
LEDLFDTHIPSIDGDPVDVTEQDSAEEQPADPAQQAEAEQPAETNEQPESEPEKKEEPQEANWFPDRPELNEQIAKLAKEIPNLDPASPEGLKTLRRMAEKDIYFSKVKGEREQYERRIADLEKRVQAAAQQRPAPQDAPRTPEQQQRQDGEIVGQNWHSWEDAQMDLAAAWNASDAQGNPKPDLRRVAEVNNAIFARQLDQYAPFIEQMIDQRARSLYEERFGPIEPQVREMAMQRQGDENIEFAMSELERTDESFNDIRNILQPVQGPPLTINGEQVQNTLFAQAVMDAPEILDIVIQGKNPIETDRLTIKRRLEAAHRVLQRKKANEERLKQATDTGQEIAKREQEGRVRHSLNKGSGTGQINGGKESTYMQELLGIQDPGF